MPSGTVAVDAWIGAWYDDGEMVRVFASRKDESPQHLEMPSEMFRQILQQADSPSPKEPKDE